MATFGESRVKLEWANKKIEDLNAGLAAFRDRGGPCTVMAEPDDQTGELVYRMRNIRAVPIELSLITGDILNALRSALDYTVRALVLAEGATPDRRCGFPIFMDFDKYWPMKGRMIKGVTPTTEARIDALQPFNPGPGIDHPLWTLQELNNADKHKLLIALAGLAGWSDISIGIAHVPGQNLVVVSFSKLTTTQNLSANVEFAPKPFALVKDGAEVLRISKQSAATPVHAQFSARVLLPQVGHLEHQSTIPTLIQLSDAVALVLNNLSQSST